MYVRTNRASVYLSPNAYSAQLKKTDSLSEIGLLCFLLFDIQTLGLEIVLAEHIEISVDIHAAFV